MKKSAVLSLTVYSLLHFAVDFTCATVMFAKVLPHGELWAVAMLLYNYFAFAMQLPFGIIADKLNKNSLVAGLGCALVAMGCFFSAFPLAAAVLCGIGNGQGSSPLFPEYCSFSGALPFPFCSAEAFPAEKTRPFHSPGQKAPPGSARRFCCWWSLSGALRGWSSILSGRRLTPCL